MGLPTFVAASLFALRLLSTTVQATSLPSTLDGSASATASNWWLSTIQRQGNPAFGTQNNYKVFRNVKDYGAKGDGVTDDTKAINAAIADGSRCGGNKCDSSTTTPAIVYFPPGTYMVKKPLELHYYTQLIGDVKNIPTLKATQDFDGIAVIDPDPYIANGQWFTPQNNFFRQVRNFRIDLTAGPDKATGIHWRVAQATSLQNIDFVMRPFNGPDSAVGQQGIFMEDGSGGFINDLSFTGGKFGMWVGNQQFTTRSLKFRNCHTAIYMNWNWLWTFHGLSIDSCTTGIDMSTQGGDTKQLGSIILVDSAFSNTQTAIKTLETPQQSGTNGTLILDNVDFSAAVGAAIQDPTSKKTILPGGSLVKSWVRGRSYQGSSGAAGQGLRAPVPRPAALTDGNGRFVTKSKPQYNNLPASSFVSVKSKGAKGDGKTDDTAAIQAVFDNIRPEEVVYFDHGAYIVTDTVKVPKNVRIVGEIWPLIMAGGSKNFQNENSPKPVFQIGQPGDEGNVEIQDLMFETQGPQPGAILVQFNVAGQTPGSAGLFDVHFRIGGTAGTNMQSDTCGNSTQNPLEPNRKCIGASLLLHVTPDASPYIENSWLWVADHELDIAPFDKVTIFNARGALIESTKGAWLWGTSSEHNVLSNYQLNKAQNVFMGFIQTETAYFQGKPDARSPFRSITRFADPDFSSCTTPTCARTWGLRVKNSKDIFLYGGGLYSFFDAYDESCNKDNNCQDNIISVDNSDVHLFGVSTKASVNMVTLDGKPAALDSDNRAAFCGTLALFEAKGYRGLTSPDDNTTGTDGTSQGAGSQRRPSSPSASASSSAQASSVAGSLSPSGNGYSPNPNGSGSQGTGQQTPPSPSPSAVGSGSGTGQASSNLSGASGQSSGPAGSANGLSSGTQPSGQPSSGRNTPSGSSGGADGSSTILGAPASGGVQSSTDPNAAQRPNCPSKRSVPRAASPKRGVTP